MAAANGHLAVVQLLHRCGVPLSPYANNGRQPIHEAAAAGHLAVVQWLQQRGGLGAEARLAQLRLQALNLRLRVERGQSSTLGWPEAGSWGHGRLPSC